MSKPVTHSGPRVLLWDIETTHNLLAAFRLWGENYHPHENIIQERYIVCACWKWLGEDKVHSVATIDDPERFNKNPHDDYHVVKTLHEVISQADIIIAHNGDSYDTKFFRGRALANKLPPLPPVKSIDTKKVAKQQFMFNSNRLDYLGKFLGVGRKIETRKGLWLDILKGGAIAKKAIKEMVIYNKQDVLLLEDVFLKLRPYIPNAINRQLFDPKAVCTHCGSSHIQSRGVHKAISREYRRYQCQTCHGWFRDEKPIKTTKPTYRVL